MAIGMPTGCCAALTKDFKNGPLSIIAGLPSGPGLVAGGGASPNAFFAAVYGHAALSSPSALISPSSLLVPLVVTSSSSFVATSAALAAVLVVDRPRLRVASAHPPTTARPRSRAFDRTA
jgi:hypothetical protein|tara:strand:- start:50 stop:409 length:360 start_codon:yes stop_codon:yes gene_type:complete